MSLKSFDKFCEKMILAEPGSEKEVYDERQKLIQKQLTLEALVVYGAMSMLAVLFNEIAYTWCEGCFPVMVLCAALAYGWWVIRNAVKGSLFGVSGKSVKYTAIIILIEVPVLILCDIPVELMPSALVRDGMLTAKAVVCASLLLYAASAAAILILYFIKRRREKSDK